MNPTPELFAPQWLANSLNEASTPKKMREELERAISAFTSSFPYSEAREWRLKSSPCFGEIKTKNPELTARIYITSRVIHHGAYYTICDQYGKSIRTELLDSLTGFEALLLVRLKRGHEAYKAQLAAIQQERAGVLYADGEVW
jgi:hypothetical protein